MNRNVYRVMYFKPDGLWHVRHGQISVASEPVKDAAVSIGRTLAARHEPSHLVVHRVDGTLETEYTYGPEEDPLPPRS